MKALAKRIWRGIKSSGTLPREEYRASVQALNIFFGAIIGVSFGQLSDIAVADYMLLLFITAAAVAVILVVSNTKRFVYSSLSLIFVMAVFWWMMYRDPIIPETPRLLFPTLLVWSVMALLTEFTPRKDEEDGDEVGEKDAGIGGDGEADA